MCGMAGFLPSANTWTATTSRPSLAAARDAAPVMHSGRSDVFDYVIAGAGSAGCVLANRLSADAGVTVALIEAGGSDSGHWIHIPAGTRHVVGNSRTDWSFRTEKEPVL